MYIVQCWTEALSLNWLSRLMKAGIVGSVLARKLHAMILDFLNRPAIVTEVRVAQHISLVVWRTFTDDTDKLKSEIGRFIQPFLEKDPLSLLLCAMGHDERSCSLADDLLAHGG